MADTILSDQGTTLANEDQGTVVAPSEGTVVAPSGTVVASGGTRIVNDATVVATSVDSNPKSNTKKKSDTVKAVFRMQEGASINLSGKTYTIVKGVSSGTEAELYVVSDNFGQYAAKIYKTGFSPNAKILPDVMAIRGEETIVDIVQSGIAEIDRSDYPYVLMEYCPYGATSNYSYRNDVSSLLEISLQVSRALDICHRNKILHKDVKPANILVKKRFPIEVCLCDFGIADKLTQKEIITSQSRTIIYAAPEMYRTGNIIDGRTYCKLTAASDYYALGMSLLSLWVGEEQFKKSEIELAYQKQDGILAIPRNMPTQLATIIKGLTSPDPDTRWDYAIIHKELSDVVMNVPKTSECPGIMYDIAENRIIANLSDLADYMQNNSEKAKKLLYRGRLSELIKPLDPLLAKELTQIVETRYKKDQDAGLSAAVFTIHPEMMIDLTGRDILSQKKDSLKTDDVKELASFCSQHHEISKSARSFLLSDTFVTWLRAKDQSAAQRVIDIHQQMQGISRQDIGSEELYNEFYYRLVLQAIDPFMDFNLCNDIESPHYAMTGERISWYINEVFNVYYSLFGGSVKSMTDCWRDPINPLKDICTCSFAKLILQSFDKKMTSHKSSYLVASLRTKGDRFDEQVKWINYCTDNEPKLGPGYNVPTAMMKVVAGLGKVPEYYFYESGKSVRTIKELESIPPQEVKAQLLTGLKGWLAVQYQDQVNLDVTEEFSYENQLHDFLEEIGKFDPEDDQFDKYKKTKDKLQQDNKAAERCERLKGLLVGFKILALLVSVFNGAMFLWFNIVGAWERGYTFFSILPGWLAQTLIFVVFLRFFIRFKKFTGTISNWTQTTKKTLILAPLQAAFGSRDKASESGGTLHNNKMSPSSFLNVFVKERNSFILMLIVTIVWFVVIFTITGWQYIPTHR